MLSVGGEGETLECVGDDEELILTRCVQTDDNSSYLTTALTR